MIKDIRNFKFYQNGNTFLGSHKGMRFYIDILKNDEGKTLSATVWPDLWSLEKTADEEKQTKEFRFSEDGLAHLTAWLNSTYETEKEKWHIYERDSEI